MFQIRNLLSAIAPILQQAGPIVNMGDAQTLGNINGYPTILFQVTGTWTGSLELQLSIDNYNWQTVDVIALDNTDAPTSTVTVNGLYLAGSAGASYVQLVATGAMTGTANVILQASGVSAPVYASGTLSVTPFSGTIGSVTQGTVPWVVSQYGTWSVAQDGTWTVAATQSGAWTIGTAPVPDTVTSGTLIAPGGALVVGPLNANCNVLCVLSGTWTGQVNFQGSLDGITWYDLTASTLGATSATPTVFAVANGRFLIGAAGFAYIQAVATALSVGTVDVELVATTAAQVVYLGQEIEGNVGIYGTVPVTQSGTWTVQQGTPPWSVSQSGVWTATVSGTVTADQGGAWTVAATQSGAWTVAATQSGSWTVTADQGGSWTVAATQSGAWTIASSPVADSSASGTLHLVGDVVTLTGLNADCTVLVQLTGTWGGYVFLEGTLDGSHWWPLPTQSYNLTLEPGAGMTAIGLYFAAAAGCTAVRCTGASLASGTATVTLRASTGPNAVYLNSQAYVHLLDSQTPAAIYGAAPILPIAGVSNDGTALWEPLPLGAGGRSVIVEGHAGGTAIPVSGTFYLATQPVSGTVTANQGTAALLASAWPVQVTDGTHAMPAGDASARAVYVTATNTSFAVTQSGGWTATVSGTVAATQGGSWTVAATQSGSWTVTATQSGTWTVTASGTVTANAGSSWATSGLAKETGGNLATVAGAVLSGAMEVAYKPSGGQLFTTAIDLNTSGDHTLVAASVGSFIGIFRLWFVCSGTVVISFKDGAGFYFGHSMAFTSGGGMVLDFSGEPWFICSLSQAFIINLSANVQVSGGLSVAFV